tara:strand:+ start:1094 stop:1570 length:477 start_codon:yes stop_codon:yes gene_type:complete
MAGLYGFSSLVLDTKGRIAMPAKYKDQLKNLAGGSLIVTRDPQYPSLLIYPGNLWKKISNSFEGLSGLNPEIRSLQWNFLGNAHYMDFEISERMNILLPLSLREYAQLKEKTKVVLIGMGQKFELWSEKNWKIKESGKEIKGERIEIDLPEEVREIPF